MDTIITIRVLMKDTTPERAREAAQDFGRYVDQESDVDATHGVVSYIERPGAADTLFRGILDGDALFARTAQREMPPGSPS